MKWLLPLASSVLVGCSSGFCLSDNSGNNGDAGALQIIAPKIIYSNLTSASSGYVTIINPTATAIKNLHYSLSKQIGGGSAATINHVSADNCSVISPHGQCNLKIDVAAGAVAGSLGISANNNSSTLTQLFKSTQSTTNLTLPVGIEQAYFNSIPGADGITISYYHTVIAGVPYIMVSGIVASTNAGNFNNIALVDSNGNVIPNQQLISGTAGSAQGSTFSILLPVPAGSGSSQTIKVQTQRVAIDGSITVVSTATTANTLTTTSGVGITDMLPGAVYLTAANPEQTITFANNGDVAAQLQSFAASNPNIEVVFSPTNLASGGIAYATLKLKTSASAASSGSATLSYNNGKEQVKTAAVVEQNINPQPTPTPTPTPPVPTAGLTAILTPDNNFFTTTAIGTVSRQLTLTNTGNTAENGFVLTLPANFTISTGTSNSCTITQETSPATISNSLAANGNCTVSVVYTNSSSVDPAQSADISIAYNYNGSTAATPATAAVNYKVTQSTANLTLTPNPVTFVNVLNNGADSNSQTVTVTNSGDETATSLAFNISGTDNTLFSTIAGGSCTSGGSLSSTNGSNSCTINIQFGTAISSVGAGSKTASLDVSYTPYTNGSTRTASTVLNGQVVAAQGANIAQGTATASGFAGGTGADVANAYQIQQNATPLPTISYTITNSGPVPANNFYLSGSASGWTMDDGCGTSISKVPLAASGGSCTVTFTMNSTATTGAQNLDVSGITMNWVDQDTPDGQTQNMSGTQYVNVYAPASIAITTSPTSNISIAPGNNFTITATLTGGYNVAPQAIRAALTTGTVGDVTFSNNDCALNSQNSYSCTITVNALGSAAAATGDVVTLSNTTTPSMAPSPATVSFDIAQPIVRIYLPQTGQLYCVAGTAYTTTCTSPAIASPAGSDGYGQLVSGNYIPYGVAWAYNGSGALNPLTRFTTGTQADGTACTSGQEVENDNLTGLMWVQNPSTTTYKWQDTTVTPNTYPAQAAIDAMNASGYCGYNDWRLPNVNELASVVNQGAEDPSAWLNGNGFSNVQANFYWSSTTYASTTANAWYVSISDGTAYALGTKNTSRYVWPVRGTTTLPAQIPQTGQTTSYAAGDDGALQKGTVGTTASGRFIAATAPNGTACTSGQEVESDLQTDLMWVKAPSATTYSWADAIAKQPTAGAAIPATYCGYSDWRLPNRNELRSLVNYGQVNMATWLNSVGFDNVQADAYWSSTTYATTTDFASFVSMDDGYLDAYAKTDGDLYVWPVRGGQ